MKDNIILASDGSEVYTNRITELADQFINCELDEERRQNIYNKSSIFRTMILYISDNIDKPDNNDIDLLDNIFNIYIRLCVKYDKLPTLELFSMLININPATITRWINGEYRANIYYDSKGEYIKDFAAWQLNHKGEQYRVEPSTAHCQTAKKWKEICAGLLMDDLSNTDGTSANKIFTAKAAYQKAEVAPIPPTITEQNRTAEQIAADYGPQTMLPGDVVPDF